MAGDRQFDFTVGAESSTRPTVGATPTDDADLITLAYFEANQIATTIDLSSVNVTVPVGSTRSHHFLIIDTGFTHTISGQLFSAGGITVNGTLTIPSGGTVLIV